MEHFIYLNGIKNALRARGINYAHLAESLKMTESGVKKMLNAKDISLRRVLQVCEVLDILPGQLFALSEEASIPLLRFSDKQEEALIHDRKLLMIYWLITIERLSPTQIAHQYDWSEKELKKTLQKLVRLDLINQRKESFLPKHQKRFRWPDDSKLTRILNREWSELTLERALRAESSKNHRLIAVKLSASSYDALLARISAVFDEAVKTSEMEELASSVRKLQDVTALFAVINKSVFSTSSSTQNESE